MAKSCSPPVARWTRSGSPKSWAVSLSRKVGRPTASRPVWKRWIPRDVPITPKTLPRVCRTSVQAVHITHQPSYQRGAAPTPGSVVTIWCNGWTARQRALPIWGGKGRTGSVNPNSRPASMCSRTSVTEHTTIRAIWRSVRPSRPRRTSPTRSFITMPLR